MPAPKQRMLQLQFTLDSGVRILRQLPADTSAADIQNVESDMCAHLGAVLGRPPAVTDRTCNEVWRRALQKEGLHFTNLCGRIQHAGQMRSVRPHMHSVDDLTILLSQPAWYGKWKRSNAGTHDHLVGE